MTRRIVGYLPARSTVPITAESRLHAHLDDERRRPRHSVACVFMSHKTGDYQEAEVVGRELSAEGLGVYFVEDDPNVAAGDRDELPDEIKEVMRWCSGLLVYASSRLVDEDSSWVCFEVGLAEMRDSETARYTTTYRSSQLLSPIRGLAPVEDRLDVWAQLVKLRHMRLVVESM